MPDRYEEGIRALQDAEPPEQWEDIRQRASGGLIVPLDGERRDRRLRWPTLLGAAAALVLALGAATLLLRGGDDVTTNPADDGLRPPIDGPADPSTTEAPAPTTEAPATTPPSATTAPSTSDTTTGAPPSLAACPLTLGLTTSMPPAGWPASMIPAAEWVSTGLPAGTREDLAGVFNGPTDQAYVFVIAGLPSEQDDGFELFPGPVAGVDARMMTYAGEPGPENWYVEAFIPRTGGDCWVTLIVLGMARDEVVGFVQGFDGS